MNGTWHAHTGNSPPVLADVWVEVAYRSGVSVSTGRAGLFDWKHRPRDHTSADIVWWRSTSAREVSTRNRSEADGIPE